MGQSATDENFTNSTVAADTCTYDAEGRVSSESEQVPGLTPVVTLGDQYTAGNRTQLAAMIGTTADFVNNYQYAFDPSNNLYGQMSQVTQSGVSGGDAVDPKRVDFTYDADGQFSTIDRCASLDTSQPVADSAYAYNAAGQITSLTHTAADGTTTYAAYSWSYNASGEVASFGNNANVADYSAEDVGTYSYDATGQLTSAAPPIGTAANAANSLSNAYDANGNATSLNGATAAVGADNTLANDGTWAYFYDADGNLVSKVGDTGGSASGTAYDYSYDNRNRLTSVTETFLSYTVVITYTYDAFDNLIGRTLTANCPMIPELFTQQRFVYDGTNAVLAFSGNCGIWLSDRYLWGPAGQMLADEGYGFSPSATRPGTTLWELDDNQNSVRDLVADNGTLAMHYAYSPFGQELPGSDSIYYDVYVENFSFGYTGAYTDLWTADQLHGVRWYDPSTQRWLTQDPIGFLGGQTNLSEYCGNAPTDATDPSGLQAPGMLETQAIIDMQSVHNKPPPDHRRDPGFKICQRDIDASDIAGAVVNECGGEHTYLQFGPCAPDGSPAKGTQGWGVTNTHAKKGKAAAEAEQRFHPSRCRPLHRNGGTLKYGPGPGKGKSSFQATDAEIIACIKATPMSQDYSFGQYCCSSWAADAAAAAGLSE